MARRDCLAAVLIVYTLLSLLALPSNDPGSFVMLWMIAGLVAGFKASRLREAISTSIAAPFIWNFTLGLFMVAPKLLGPPGRDIDIVFYPFAAVIALFGFSIACAAMAAIVAGFAGTAKMILTGGVPTPRPAPPPPPPPPPAPPRVDKCAMLMEEVRLVESELRRLEDEASRL